MTDTGKEILERSKVFVEYLEKDFDLTNREKFLLRHFLLMLGAYIEARDS